MVKVAVDLVKEGLIDEKEAVRRLEPAKLDELMHPSIDPKASKKVLAKGLPASPGAAIGKIVFTASEAEALAEKEERVILVRVETSPEDIHGMKAAQGILTARGGMTSHAAVVARGMGKCCVAGCSALAVDYQAQRFSVQTPSGTVVVKRGDVITLDGGKGEVIVGAVPMTAAALDDNWTEVMTWVDGARRLRVRTNADTPVDAKTARVNAGCRIGRIIIRANIDGRNRHQRRGENFDVFERCPSREVLPSHCNFLLFARRLFRRRRRGRGGDRHGVG